jgi:Tyrosyl-tRNA synthetase
MNIIDELSWRGLINQQSDEEGLRSLVDEKTFHFTVVWIQLGTQCISVIYYHL